MDCPLVWLLHPASSRRSTGCIIAVAHNIGLTRRAGTSHGQAWLRSPPESGQGVCVVHGWQAGAANSPSGSEPKCSHGADTPVSVGISLQYVHSRMMVVYPATVAVLIGNYGPAVSSQLHRLGWKRVWSERPAQRIGNGGEDRLAACGRRCVGDRDIFGCGGVMEWYFKQQKWVLSRMCGLNKMYDSSSSCCMVRIKAGQVGEGGGTHPRWGPARGWHVGKAVDVQTKGRCRARLGSEESSVAGPSLGSEPRITEDPISATSMRRRLSRQIHGVVGCVQGG